MVPGLSRDTQRPGAHTAKADWLHACCAAAEGQTFEPTQAAKAIEGCTKQLEERFDARLGGFGGAPKFPRPAEINLLHIAHLRDSSSDRATSSSDTSSSGALMGLHKHLLKEHARG